VNAGSIQSCKYGSTARYVLNLQIVLPTGEILWTGSNIRKNSTGMDLTPLFVGTGGTLGIITKVVYQLIRKPCYETTILAGFANQSNACKAVIGIRNSRYTPSAVEIVCNSAIRLASAYLSKPLPLVEQNITTHLLVSLQEASERALEDSLEYVGAILEDFSPRDMLVARSLAEKEKLWELRFAIGPALSQLDRYYRDIDIAVPVAMLFEYITHVENVCSEYNQNFACFGHAIDGNPHVMLILENEEQLDDNAFKKAVSAIYSYAAAQGGVISAEHGVGIVQKEFMELQFSPLRLSLMKNIKSLFDPHNIMNPGKIIDMA